MRFAESIWLFGMFGALILAALLGVTAFRHSRALTAFAEKTQLHILVTARPTVRRTLAAILLISAVLLAFLAAAAPQYGKGTRILPRTNLDVVIALDFSKSMYARDISPSRIERSKIEVQRLVQKLAGARFGAIAFAGEPMAFPLTSDGAAIAQFFIGLTPNDMPVGGTSTSRAIEAARQLLLRDPISKNHEKVIVLITDGEDLEGNPVDSARSAQSDGIGVSVVQIGGQSPEPIPDIDEHGQSRGYRKDSRGQILTTHLSEEGERQLEEIAAAGRGTLVRAGKGDTGIDEMAESLRKRMTDELSERVETVYADVFQYPLGLAVILLVLEVFVSLNRKRPKIVEPPRDQKRRRRLKRTQMQSAALLLLALGCQPYDKLFERKSPVVEEAIAALQAGEHDKATELLTNYLETGACQEGVIGIGSRGRAYPDASFDLGLAFVAEPKGPTPPAGAPAPGANPAAQPADPALPGLGLPDPALGAVPGAPPSAAPGAAPSPNLDCALRVLAPIADAESESAALRARAFYLMGNVEVLRGNYDAAIVSYKKGLRLAPGLPEGQGDPIGRDLAHNHAVALKLLEEKKKQEEEQKKDQDEQNQSDDKDQQKDQEQKDDQEGDDDKNDDQNKDDQKPEDQRQDDQKDSGQEDQKDQQKPEEQKDDQKGDDKSDDKQAENDQQQGDQEQPAPAPEPPQNRPSASQDDRILDQLEQSPTLQQHTAQKRAGSGRSGMEDK